jgi:hypothetical protein
MASGPPHRVQCVPPSLGVASLPWISTCVALPLIVTVTVPLLGARQLALGKASELLAEKVLTVQFPNVMFVLLTVTEMMEVTVNDPEPFVIPSEIDTVALPEAALLGTAKVQPAPKVPAASLVQPLIQLIDVAVLALSVNVPVITWLFANPFPVTVTCVEGNPNEGLRLGSVGGVSVGVAVVVGDDVAVIHGVSVGVNVEVAVVVAVTVPVAVEVGLAVVEHTGTVGVGVRVSVGVPVGGVPVMVGV